jgi:hypothetical protein
MNQITTIDGVIAQLDDIIKQCITGKSRIGYFATLYRRMTVAVKQAILDGSFQDGPRMEQLDVIFANRYFAAWEAYTNKQPCTNAWCAAFGASENADLIVLQQLILGINTHINLDLCIAAADCCPGDKIYGLDADFQKINAVIAEQAQLVQDTLCKIWFPLRLLTDISNNQEKAVLNFSIDTARSCSWANALVLAASPDSLKDQHINEIDHMVVQIGNRIIHPGMLVNFILKPVHWMENKDIGKLIMILQN